MPTPLGVPIKLFHESEGHKVSVELLNGEIYHGLMRETEDNMNCQLQLVTLTSRTGQSTRLEYVFIRGSKIRFIVIPDMLRNSPVIKKFDPRVAKAAAQGKLTTMPNITLPSRGGASRGRGRGRGGNSGSMGPNRP